MPALINKKRVAIVGAGASGMSAAFALSLSKDEFEVKLFESASYCGGMATSVDIDPTKYGASYINAGVQGASPVFFNIFALFKLLGFESSTIGMTVAFNKEDGEFWSNCFPTSTIDLYSKDIVKFGTALKVIKYSEPIWAMISVSTMLSMFGFSKSFGEVIVYPLTALFFGTGNQTPFVSSAILARVFNDESMRLFEFSPSSFLASIPSMRAFPRLSLIYSEWQKKIESNGNVAILTSTEVTSVDRSIKGVGARIKYRATGGINLAQETIQLSEKAAAEVVEDFDEIILATDANIALKLLESGGKGASWMEKKVLGNVKYLYDVTVTHSDTEYMKKYYVTEYEESMASKQRYDDKKAQADIQLAREAFQPLYFTRSYPSDKKKIEMSFDLTHYQPQFNGYDEYGHSTSTSEDESSKKEPIGEYKHVFQTIFLDRDSAQHLWTKNEINPSEIMLEQWWKQQSHRVQHYRWTVPFMMFINGRNHTRLAGAWSLLNMHEIAMVSGFSAAYQLGGKYPFVGDEKCKRLFSLYMLLAHGSRMRSEDRTGFLA